MLDSPFDDSVYHGRPGISPVVATLFACEMIDPDSRILVAGCGYGTDARALAAWGCNDVVGVDTDRVALAEATMRAREEGTSRRLRFVQRDATSCPVRERGAYDVLIDTFLFSNLEKKRVERAYFAACADYLRPGGLLVIQVKYKHRYAGKLPARRDLPDSARYFKFGPSPVALIPEYPAFWLGERDGQPWAPTRIFVGRRNGVPTR